MSSTIHAAVTAAIADLEGRIGVACSGGADSTTLAHAAIRIAGAERIVVLTIDHGLRDASAQVADEVAAWARGQGTTSVIRRVTIAPRASLEAAAREARYAALESLADEHELATILVGHTARDQAETVLLRLLRGTGPAGLAAMAPRRGRFVRPLLAITREEIDAYVVGHALPIWIDPMNADLRHARVRVRDEILPLLARENPQLPAALTRLAASTREWLEVIDALATPHARLPIDCPTLAVERPAIRKRALAIALDAAHVDYDASHLDALDALVMAPTSGQRSLDLPGARLVRTYDSLAIATPASTPTAPTITAAGYTLRTWQPGDRMCPARLRGHSRKLADLFIDAKVPRDQRTTARVVERAGVILWAEHVGIGFGVVEADLKTVVPAGADLVPDRAGRTGNS